MKESIKNCIDNLKHLPGVYLMHNADNQIIYIGKAKDLYKRVSQYFLRPQAGKVAKMAMEAEYFKTIICNNEKEAFVLEMNLIQTHYPKYNILLKDDSHYPYIALKKKGDPFLAIKRNKKESSYDYFGPYPRSTFAFEVIDLLNKIFPIRKCKNLGHETCLYFHLHQCLAPCVNKIDEETNSKLREDIKSFMRGDNSSIRREYVEKMNKASQELDFESAMQYKGIIEAIDHINAKQNVEISDKKDRDIFAFSSKEGYICLAMLLYRKGILLDKKAYIVESFGDIEEQVSDLITQFYSHIDIPNEIVVSSEIVKKNIEDVLDSNILCPSKGRLHDLIISAKENADNEINQYFISSRIDEDKLSLLEELGKILNIKTPLQIDLFDNSHIQGSSPVGAMVSFVNGEPAKKLYRKFKIEHEEARDDIKSMKEIIFRHYSRSKDENKKLPDLILVDGGLIQIEAAVDALKGVEVNIPVFGLVKNNKHQTSGLMNINKEEYPIENKKLFFLLTRMQDEVHRFAISFHREKRGKAMTASILDDIPGLGDKRKEMIYKAYPDITLLRNASIEELSQILPRDVAIDLHNKLNK
ncbi:MAG: excinuclease ABC subunit UvrC [Bacilli bacterium]|nr:excinuclease ABC subunit UvrC [Bacilli bacterium]